MLFNWRIHIKCLDGSVYNIIYPSYEDNPTNVEDEIKCYGNDFIHIANSDTLIHIRIENVAVYLIENVTDRTTKEVME